MAVTYITTKDADVYAYNGITEYPASSPVGTIAKGTPVEIVNTTSGGIGFVATNFLELSNGTYILASAASKEGSFENTLTGSDSSLRNGIIITALIIAGIYFANKYSKHKI